MKTLKKYLLTTIILFGVFISALFLVSFIPRSAIKNNVIKSSAYMGIDNHYKTVYLNFDLKARLEAGSDYLMINNCYSIDTNNKLESIILQRRNYNPGITEIIKTDRYDLDTNYNINNHAYDLFGLFSADKDYVSYIYHRYWHGYEVILRPLLMFFNEKQMRVLHFYTLLFLILTLCFALYKRNKKIESFIIFATLITTHYNEMHSVLEGYYLLISTLILSILITMNIINKKNIFIIEFIFGAIIQYLDFLTTPALSYLFPIIIYYIVNNKEFISYKDTIKFIFLTGINWLLGYTILWASKWVLADALYNLGTIKEVIQQFIMRTVNTKHTADVNFGVKQYMIGSFMEPINFYSKENALMILTIGLSFVLMFIKSILVLFRKAKFNIKDNLFYIICILIMASWFLVFSEHTSHHYFFTYRNCIIYTLCILLITKNIIRDFIKQKKNM